jgi:hypothetical protein
VLVSTTIPSRTKAAHEGTGFCVFCTLTTQIKQDTGGFIPSRLHSDGTSIPAWAAALRIVVPSFTVTDIPSIVSFGILIPV